MANLTIERFEERILAAYDDRDCAPKTKRQAQQVLRELRAIGVRRSFDVADCIGNWKRAHPQRSPVTFRSHLRCLSSICGVAEERGWIKRNPFARKSAADWIRGDSRPAPPRRRYAKPIEDMRRVLQLADAEAERGDWLEHRTRAYVYALFLTGARPGEIQRLRLIDFRAARGELEICAHWITGRGGRRYWWRPKTEGSSGILPTGPVLTSVLADWSRCVLYESRRGRLRIRDCEWLFPGENCWGPWTGGGPGKSPLDVVKALGSRAGVVGLTQKAARKGLGTFHEIGLTPLGRRLMMRHSDDATGDWYDERSVESRRPDAQAIERFFLHTGS